MKSFLALSVVFSVVMLTAAMAGADLCPNCAGKAYTADIGNCANCGAATTSGAFKLCKACSAKLGQCEHCRAALKPPLPVALGGKDNAAADGVHPAAATAAAQANDANAVARPVTTTRGASDLAEIAPLLAKAVGGEWKRVSDGLARLEGTIEGDGNGQTVSRFQVYPFPYDMAGRKRIMESNALPRPIMAWPKLIGANDQYTVVRVATGRTVEDLGKPCPADQAIVDALKLAMVPQSPAELAHDLPWGMPPPVLRRATSPAEGAKILADLAKALDSNDVGTIMVAIEQAAALIHSTPADANMMEFLPLVEPLFTHANYGGEGTPHWSLAANLLVRIGGPGIPLLRAKLLSDESHDRWSAMDILSRIGEPKDVVLSSAVSLLRDRDRFVRRTAVEALGKQGKEAKEATAALEADANDEYEPIQVRIQWALIRIEGVSDRRIKAIAGHLESQDREFTAGYAASVLGEIGEPARIVIPDLEKALNHPDGTVRDAARDAVRHIREAGKSATQAATRTEPLR